MTNAVAHAYCTGHAGPRPRVLLVIAITYGRSRMRHARLDSGCSRTTGHKVIRHSSGTRAMRADSGDNDGGGHRLTLHAIWPRATPRQRVQRCPSIILKSALARILRVPWPGLEPGRLTAPPPQDGVSTNSTTRADKTCGGQLEGENALAWSAIIVNRGSSSGLRSSGVSPDLSCKVMEPKSRGQGGG